jgi:hypothetical protein
MTGYDVLWKTVNWNDPFAIIAGILLAVIVIRGLHLLSRYRKPKSRIFLAGLAVGAAYFVGFSSYFPDQGIDSTQQKIVGVFLQSLALIPLFYKSRKKERIPFAAETREKVLEKQNYKCALCRKSLVRFNIDFDHINGNRSDDRLSNCRALCTPCHRKRHANKD